MRNPDLDRKLPEDDLISELHFENGRGYRIVDGKKVYQIEEKTKGDEDLNLIINRYRCSGMRLSEYMKMNL